MSAGKGVISSEQLMRNLVNAKKVMNKVDTGDFTRGNINEDILTKSPEELQALGGLPQKNKTNIVNVDKIQNSKLPDAIKKAMIENPIPQISLNDNIDSDIVRGAKKLMEREGMIPKSSPAHSSKQSSNNSSFNMNDFISIIKPLMESTIREVLDEKLNQILTAQQTLSINENLVLKVGDSVFKGKITGVNKTK